MVDLGLFVYNKVQENVTGKILQIKTGDLSRSIKVSVRTSGNPMTLTVGPEPVDVKAWVLEHGGKGYYKITPKYMMLLHWVDEEGSHFRKRVWHPPMKAHYYMGTVLEEIDFPSYFDEMSHRAFTRAEG